MQKIWFWDVHPSTMDRACSLVCAVGNSSALRTYESLGFQSMGQGNSEACMEAIGIPGFCVMRTSLWQY